MTERCDYCLRRLDRPGMLLCPMVEHPRPTFAQRIVNAIEHDLNSRRGLGIDTLDNDAQDAILDTWTALIEDEIARAFK
jgi:hypothetical protein